jgi:hypothetical protein
VLCAAAKRAHKANLKVLTGSKLGAAGERIFSGVRPNRVKASLVGRMGYLQVLKISC